MAERSEHHGRAQRIPAENSQTSLFDPEGIAVIACCDPFRINLCSDCKPVMALRLSPANSVDLSEIDETVQRQNIRIWVEKSGSYSVTIPNVFSRKQPRVFREVEPPVETKIDAYVSVKDSNYLKLSSTSVRELSTSVQEL